VRDGMAAREHQIRTTSDLPQLTTKDQN